jgi:hypothetical protein
MLSVVYEVTNRAGPWTVSTLERPGWMFLSRESADACCHTLNCNPQHYPKEAAYTLVFEDRSSLEATSLKEAIQQAQAYKKPVSIQNTERTLVRLKGSK